MPRIRFGITIASLTLALSTLGFLTSYRGPVCIPGALDVVTFATLPLIFSASFVVLIAFLLSIVAQPLLASPTRQFAAASVAIAVHVLIGVSGWLLIDIPGATNQTAAWVWIPFWIIGFSYARGHAQLCGL